MFQNYHRFTDPNTFFTKISLNTIFDPKIQNLFKKQKIKANQASKKSKPGFNKKPQKSIKI